MYIYYFIYILYIYILFYIYIIYIYIYAVWFKVGNKLVLHELHKLKCSVPSRAILIGEITTHKCTGILFHFCQFHACWASSDDKIYYKTYKKDLSNVVWF